MNYAIRSNNFILLAAFFIGLSELDFVYDPFRYLKYLLLPIAIFVMMTSSNWQRNIKDKIILSFLGLLAWGIISGFLNLSLDSYGLKDLFFIAVYVISLLAFINGQFNVKYLFYIFTGLTILSFTSRDAVEFSVAESTAPFESTSCFVFAAFYIYFLIQRQFIFAVISLFFVFITLKRIVIPPLLIATIFYLSNQKIKKIVTSKSMLYAIAFVFPLFLVFLTLGVFDEIIEITTGRNANWITLGRTSHYQGVVELIYEQPFKLILGNGVGSSYLPSASFYDSDNFHIGNLHSDFLKILFEFGIVAYCLFFYTLIKFSSIESRLFLFLLFFLYGTDNVFIYSGISFIIISLMIRVKMKSDSDN